MQEAPEDFLMRLLAALHLRWRFAVFMPVLYFLAAALISHTWFRHKGGGFLQLTDVMIYALLGIGGAFSFMAWRLLSGLKIQHEADLAAVRNNPAEFYDLAIRQQWFRLSVCDVASAPGILIFLLQGSVGPIVAFLLLSMCFYLSMIPSGKRLGEVLLKNPPTVI